MGLRVIDITIWPLGGMARMEGLYDRPSAEAPVALAGPLVNLALAGGCALLPGPLALAGAGINLVLGLGNLVPAFPLDGGRVLRAWLARRSPLTDATQAAVRVGGWAAVCLLLLSATLLDSIGLGLLLLGYVWFTGRMELMQVILRTGRPPSMGTGEVFRRAFRSGDSGQEVHSQPEEPADPRVDELENFRGDLDEFFTGRRR
jgi:Zn-dependent protease